MDSIYPPNFARFYDPIYSKILSGADSVFYLKKASEANGAVLEAGSGTGRFFIDALNQGTNIYGIDISPSMIDILKTKINKEQHHRVSVQNILDFSFDHQFKLILAPFRVFMHLTEVSDQLKALNNIYNQLLPGGEFIFDLFIPDPNIIANGITESVDFEGEYMPGEKLRRITNAKYDLVNQIAHVKMRFEWTENKILNEETWDTSLRLFFRFELEHLLFRSQFKDYSIFGDFNEKELCKESKEFVVICRKGLEER